MSDFVTYYDENEKIWRGLKKPKLCDENISVGAVALKMLRSKNPQEIMQICDSENISMTYGTALSSAIKIAKYFNKLRLTGDDVVGIFSPDTTYIMPVALAAWFNGTPFQAIYCKLEKSVVANLYEFSKPKIIFCDGWEYEKVKSVSETFKPLIFTLCNHLENVPKVQDLLEEMPADEEEEESLFQTQPLKYGSDQTMAILVSSGTSGQPKGVCVPNRMCLTDFGFSTENTKMFSNRGIDWSSGLLTFMANVLVGGLRIITSKPLTPEYLLELIVKYEINFLATNPAVLLPISLLKSFNPESLKSIKLIFTAGTHCTEFNLERIRSALLQGLLFYGYGTTETGGVAGRFNKNKPKSVGRLLPNVQLKIVDPKTGEQLGPGEIGELCINQGYEWQGYYNNTEATTAILDQDGFIRTGDLGYMDEENFLFLVGRCKEVMKFQGLQYLPSDIEEIIAEIPDIVDVCVFGVYDEIKQDMPAAAVVKKEESSLTAEDIIKYVESRTEAPHKRVQYGVFFVKELIRNHNGKLMRDQIKEMCLEMEKDALEK
ncbi:uncharacterized protein ACRADG_003444 [Cochliomyia hominivorax]